MHKVKSLIHTIWDGIFDVFSIAFILVFSASLAFVFNHISETTAKKEIPAYKFQAALHAKEKKAIETLEFLQSRENIVSEMTDRNDFLEQTAADGIEYRVYSGDRQIYWTGNEVQTGALSSFPNKYESYYCAENYHCVCLRSERGEYTYIAMIMLKERPFAGGEDGRFCTGFDMEASVSFDLDSRDATYPIIGTSGAYLFGLSKVPYFKQNQTYMNLCSACWFIFIAFYILLLVKIKYIYNEGRISRKWHNLIITFLLILISCSFYFGLPACAYSVKLFSEEYHFVSYGLVYTLLLYSFYILVLVNAPLRAKENEEKRVVISRGVVCNILMGFHYASFYILCRWFVWESELDFSVPFAQDISVYSLLSLLVVMLWVMMLVYVTIRLTSYFRPNFNTNPLLVCFYAIFVFVLLVFLFAVPVETSTRYIVLSMVMYGYFMFRHTIISSNSAIHHIAIALFVVPVAISTCVDLSDKRNDEIMMNLGKKISQGNLMQKDAVAERLAASLYTKLKVDETLHAYLVEDGDCSMEAEKYFLEKYHNGYWCRYDMDVQIVNLGENLSVRTGNWEGRENVAQSFITGKCDRVGRVDFYRNLNTNYPLCYSFVLYSGLRRLFVLLYPSPSYQRLSGFAGETRQRYGLPTGMDVSVAKYVDGKLHLWDGKYHYPPSSLLLNFSTKDTHIYSKDGYRHYVNKCSDSVSFVVSTLEKHSNVSLILIFTLLGCFVFLYGVCYFIQFLWQGRLRKSIFMRMFIFIMMPLTVAFVALAWFSFSFFIRQYRTEQLASLSDRITTIQRALQENVGFAPSLAQTSTTELEDAIKRVGDIVRSEILIYDASGSLYAASNMAPKVLGLGSAEAGQTRMISPFEKFSSNLNCVRREKVGDTEYQSLYSGLFNQGNVRIGYVQILVPHITEYERSRMFNLLIMVMDVFFLVILLAMLFVWLISKSFSRTLEEITRNFNDIKLMGETPKITYSYAEDEIGMLVSRYNDMVDKLKAAAEELTANERDSAWREMARSIAHEIKNPLTPMKLTIQMALLKQETDPEHFAEQFKRTGAILIEQIENLAGIATEFSDFAKITAGRHEPIDICTRLRNVIDLYKNNSEGVIIVNNIPEDMQARIMGEEKQMTQVFSNLIKNAIQAIPSDALGLIEVNIKKENDNVVIWIKDNGIGIKPEVQEKLFEPNFTTKTSGMGLGLAITRSIVNVSNGRIWFETAQGEGTTFFLSFPLV